jgi:hypothetical protein
LCPNISLSSSGPGSAAQLTGMSLREARRLCWWMYWAMSSLPVPLSPKIITEASVLATRLAMAMAWRSAPDSPISVSSSSSAGAGPSGRRSRPDSSRSPPPAAAPAPSAAASPPSAAAARAACTACAARPTSTWTCEALNGFGR